MSHPDMPGSVLSRALFLATAATAALAAPYLPRPAPARPPRPPRPGSSRCYSPSPPAGCRSACYRCTCVTGPARTPWYPGSRSATSW